MSLLWDVSRQGGVVGVTSAQAGRPGTREALLEAVDALVSERGWSECSLQAVARRAGLTTGAVYSTFGSRGALLAASMVRRIEADAGLLADEPDLQRAITVFARKHHTATQVPEGVHLVLAQLDLVRLGSTDAGVAAALRLAHERLLDALTADVVARSDIQAGPARELAQRLVGVLQGLTLQQIAFGGDLSERVFVDAATNAMGLAAPG
jgi:AcrR family transcriptional regulator